MLDNLFPMHLLVVLAILAPAIFFLLTLRKTLARCSEQSHPPSPGSVWLMLIPLVNVVYQFILVGHIAKSLGNEFTRRGIAEPNLRQVKSVGMLVCVLDILAQFPFGQIATGLQILIAITALICWIIYWVGIARFSRMIAVPFSTSQQPE